MIDVSDVSDSAVARHLSTLSGEVQQIRRDMREGFEMVVKAMHDIKNELRAEFRADRDQLRIELRTEITETRAEITQLRADTGRMIAASTESLRSEWRVLLEHSDARFALQQAALEAHISDPHAHAHGR